MLSTLVIAGGAMVLIIVIAVIGNFIGGLRAGLSGRSYQDRTKIMPGRPGNSLSPANPMNAANQWRQSMSNPMNPNSPLNPANPNNSANRWRHSMSNPMNPNSPLNTNNPMNPNSPLNSMHRRMHNPASMHKPFGRH
jgi:hypothetical protein